MFNRLRFRESTDITGITALTWNQLMEPTIGIEPMNLFLTKEVLYLLSYVGLRVSSQQEDWRRSIA